MVTIYRPIEQLYALAEIADIPYTESQIVDFGIQLIKNMRDYDVALAEWNRKQQDEKHGMISRITFKTPNKLWKTYKVLP